MISMLTANHYLKKAINNLNFAKRRKKIEEKRALEELRAFIVTENNRRDGLFDAEWYAAAYPDVAAEGRDSFSHYMKFGRHEGRNPGPAFDDAFYLATYPDVGADGLVPLDHYLRHGRAAGRSTRPPTTAVARAVAQHTIVKELNFVPGTDAAIFVTHAPAGRLKPHVLHHIRLLRGCGVSVLLTAVVDRPLELREEELAEADGIIVRDNAGYDFGAWAHAIEIEPALFGASMLILTNDSIIPSSDAEMFAAMMMRVRNNPADIVGLTASHEHGWHIQSYFLAMKPKALVSLGFRQFFGGIERIDNKDVVIHSYEIPFAARMKAAGLTVAAAYMGSFAANPTFYSWRELIEQGYPFIKLLMLRKSFPASVPGWTWLADEMNEQWPSVLESAGFDLDLVNAAILSAEISGVPPGPNTGHLVDGERFQKIDRNHRLRVVFIGPWNYDGRHGDASRGMVDALRRTDIRLNAYPIAKPLRGQQPICPAVATTDFGGRPDIAIVDLNPDSWALLTDKQREIIASAKRKIGVWHCDRNLIPESWAPELRSVDRIWATSRYAADVFANEVGIPVDVVPLFVPVSRGGISLSARGRARRRFGLDAEARVIVSRLDKADIGATRMPDDLIAAFAASGLASRGWTLLLVTGQNPAQARTELAPATDEVRLVEVAQSTAEMATLTAADLYAAPDILFGFDIAVAEAMAAGIPVVAAVSRGAGALLDDRCGYPVDVRSTQQDVPLGDRRRAPEIDVRAFGEALTRAAAAVEHGDKNVSRAASAQIRSDFSGDAVATAIEASLAALLDKEWAEPSARPVPPLPPGTIPVDPGSAALFDHQPTLRGVMPVSLAADLSIKGEMPAGYESSEWVFFAPGNARIAPNALNMVCDAAAERPDAVLFYADDVATAGEPLDRLRLKPEFDRTLLGAQDYIGAPVIVRGAVLAALGGLDRKRGTAALFDLVLRVADAGYPIARIPHVLIGHEGVRPAATPVDRRAALVASGLPVGADLVTGHAPDLLATRWNFSEDDALGVTICIPTRQSRRDGADQPYVAGLLAGIAAADWPMRRLTVIVGDDLPGTPDWATQAWPFTLTRLDTQRAAGETFNYSGKMNRLWRHSDDDYIIFMNDDVTPQGPGWLQALMGFAVQERVGGVGARLLYEDGALQHAGVVPSFGTVVHAWLAMAPDTRTYQDWAIAQREWSMVTGAVFATRRDILERIDGFDEAFSLEYNDIDLCLRIRNAGYHIVYNPDAEMTHAEKASRGDTIPPGADLALFFARWGAWLEHDPSSHPMMARNRLDVVPASEPSAWYL